MQGTKNLQHPYKRSCHIEKIQAHLKPYRPQSKQREAGHSISKKCNMGTVKSKHQTNNVGNLVQSRPKGALSPKSDWIYSELYD